MKSNVNRSTYDVVRTLTHAHTRTTHIHSHTHTHTHTRTHTRTHTHFNLSNSLRSNDGLSVYVVYLGH